MIFGIKIHESWVDMADYEHVRMPDYRVFNAREFGTYDRVIDFYQLAKEETEMNQLVINIAHTCPIGVALGCSGRGEGIVYTSADTSHGSRYFFKVKGETHNTVNHDHLKVSKCTTPNADKATTLQQFVLAIVTEARLLQGIDYLREMDLKVSPKNLGAFLQWIICDVLKEDSDLMEEHNIKPENLKKAVLKYAMQWYNRFMLANCNS